MIIKALGDLIYNLLNILLVFQLPALPDTVTQVFSNALNYIVQGVNIIKCFTGSTCLGVLAVLLQLILFAHGMYMLYSFVAFVLRKIPMLGLDM